MRVKSKLFIIILLLLTQSLLAFENWSDDTSFLFIAIYGSMLIISGLIVPFATSGGFYKYGILTVIQPLSIMIAITIFNLIIWNKCKGNKRIALSLIGSALLYFTLMLSSNLYLFFSGYKVDRTHERPIENSLNDFRMGTVRYEQVISQCGSPNDEDIFYYNAESLPPRLGEYMKEDLGLDSARILYYTETDSRNYTSYIYVLIDLESDLIEGTSRRSELQINYWPNVDLNKETSR